MKHPSGLTYNRWPNLRVGSSILRLILVLIGMQSNTEAPTRLRIIPTLSSIGRPLVIRQEAEPVADDPRKIWVKLATRRLAQKVAGRIKRIRKP
jgi:hypothetical protein